MAVATRTDLAVEQLSVSVYTVPTDAPESDGTLEWGSTTLVVVEAVLIVAAQRDIQRRPEAQIRGPKLLWRVIATQNVVGPAAYFAIGRKSDT